MTNQELNEKFFNSDGSRKTLGQIFTDAGNKALIKIGEDRTIQWNKLSDTCKEDAEDTAQIVFDDFLAYYKEFMY
jgi:hypothetical protein